MTTSPSYRPSLGRVELSCYRKPPIYPCWNRLEPRQEKAANSNNEYERIVGNQLILFVLDSPRRIAIKMLFIEIYADFMFVEK